MISSILKQYENLPLNKKVQVYNQCTQLLYDFLKIEHPALNVSLVPIRKVTKNDYNPNKVALPEMRLLKLSIQKDGLTMPVVVAEDKKEGEYIVVDGFHRTAICSKEKEIKQSLHGYLPIVKLNKNIEDRITATVRHNIARGTHQIELSANLVTLLKKHNWSNERIGKELGMDPDEVLRLKQISGLAEAFADEEFSQSWI